MDKSFSDDCFSSKCSLLLLVCKMGLLIPVCFPVVSCRPGQCFLIFLFQWWGISHACPRSNKGQKLCFESVVLQIVASNLQVPSAILIWGLDKWNWLRKSIPLPDLCTKYWQSLCFSVVLYQIFLGAIKLVLVITLYFRKQNKPLPLHPFLVETLGLCVLRQKDRNSVLEQYSISGSYSRSNLFILCKFCSWSSC